MFAADSIFGQNSIVYMRFTVWGSDVEHFGVAVAGIFVGLLDRVYLEENISSNSD